MKDALHTEEKTSCVLPDPKFVEELTQRFTENHREHRERKSCDKLEDANCDLKIQARLQF